MKTASDFREEENGIINAMTQVLIDRGYKAKWYWNMEQTPTIKVELKDDDGNDVEYIACFEED
jgi:hypothetical protein